MDLADMTRHAGDWNLCYYMFIVYVICLGVSLPSTKGNNGDIWSEFTVFISLNIHDYINPQTKVNRQNLS